MLSDLRGSTDPLGYGGAANSPLAFDLCRLGLFDASPSYSYGVRNRGRLWGTYRGFVTWSASLKILTVYLAAPVNLNGICLHVTRTNLSSPDWAAYRHPSVVFTCPSCRCCHGCSHASFLIGTRPGRRLGTWNRDLEYWFVSR
jgi:hypothetical protein